MLFFILIIPLAVFAQEAEDSYLWLEDIEGKKAIGWVLAQNKLTVDAIQAHSKFDKINKNVLKVYNSKERIVYPTIHGKYVTNFWQDDIHERGIWCRTLLEDYFQDSIKWETLLDLDALNKDEGEKWAFSGTNYLYPDTSLCMVELKSDWTIAGNSYKQGALISIDFDAFLSGNRNFQVIYQPYKRSGIVSVSNTKKYLLVNEMTNVRSGLMKAILKNNKWQLEKVVLPIFC
mgnify:CR=1 FL=1